ncbi:F-box family protein [Rhynchospora pubera]|uniref:F-box family protein n=1 Tax=Rhynchospora pubera TaxID=906938 RepID=A0AAV8CF96_9POAL|nr:F-box family protein [Rhynchospora pubera]
MKTSNGSSMITRPSNNSNQNKPAIEPDDDGWVTILSRQSRKEAKRKSRIVQQYTINDLPNSVLVHILSFLPTIQAAQTSVLSMRWKYLWAYVPALIIKGYGYNGGYEMQKFLQFCRSSYLRQITLMLRDPLVHESCIKWVDFAMKHKEVEELNLQLMNRNRFNMHTPNSLPRNIFSHSQSLRVLVLYGCELRNIGEVDLRNVRKLHFKKVDVVGNLLNDLLAACPRAEILKLEHSDSVIDLSANLPELKKLKLRECNQMKSARLTVPNLQVVKIEDSFESGIEFFQLCGMVNLMEAYIIHNEDGDYQVYNGTYQVYANLLQILGQAKQLTVKCSSLEIMYNWSQVIADCSAMKVTSFELISLDDCYGISSFILALLKKLPNLEEFRLHKICDIDSRNSPRDEESSNGPNYGDSLPIDCLQQCLKRISIVDYNNEKMEFELVKFLLQNSIVLENVCFLNCFGELKDYLELIEVLETCKASPKAEIVFEDDLETLIYSDYSDASDFSYATS